MIMSIVILLLLTVIAMTMISIGWIGKMTSTSYIEKIQSEFMTDSAVEYASAKILSSLNNSIIPTARSGWLFSGEDFNQNDILDPDEDTNNNGMLDTANLDIQDAIMPSFPNPEHEIISFNNHFYVPSLIHREWRGKNVHSYTFIKAIDSASLICVNNFRNRGLKLMLNNLAEYLAIPQKLGDLLFEFLQQHPQMPTNLTPAILQSIWKIEDKNKFQILLNHLSLYCWEDSKVIVPNPSPLILEKLQSLTSYEIYKIDEINGKQFNFGYFAPININLAPTIIVKASLKGLSALYFTPNKLKSEFTTTDRIDKLSLLGNTFWNFYTDTLYKVKPIGTVSKITLTDEEVEKVVEEIITIKSARRAITDPFIYNWEEFSIFVQHLVEKKILPKEKSHLIFANANPNVYSYKFNPPAYKMFKIDRLDLIDYTTTYTFFPPGIFRIEAYNILLDSKRQLIARSRKNFYVNLYLTIVETTTDDFLKGTITQAQSPTLNKKSLNIGPYPVSLFNNISFPQFDGFLEASPLVNNLSADDFHSKVSQNLGPLIFVNLIKDPEIRKKLTFQYQKIKQGFDSFSLLWDGINFNYLDDQTKTQYVNIFSKLMQVIADSSSSENPINMCYWFKWTIYDPLEENITPYFNISGYQHENKENPFNLAIFNFKKKKEDYLTYNMLSKPASQMSLFPPAYFIPNEVVTSPSKLNTAFPNYPLLVCLSFEGDSFEIYINGNKVKKQQTEIDEDIELKKFLDKIDIEKTLSRTFFQGSIDYIIYLFDGKVTERQLKSLFPQRYYVTGDKIEYTTREYQVFSMDRNCIVNIYWTDNVTATNLPDIYSAVERFSLFEADVLDEKGKILNTNTSGKVESFDMSVGVNSIGLICSNKFKVKIRLDLEQEQSKQKIYEAPFIDDIYIFVMVPKYLQVLLNESGTLK